VTKPFEQNLARLQNVNIAVEGDNIPDAEGTASIIVKFSDGTILKAGYWRFVQNRLARLSSFDHKQKYGLSNPIDAKEEITRLLDGRLCCKVEFDTQTGDLILMFDETTKLQVFNFTGYEIWTIHFPDGTGELSNYALASYTPNRLNPRR
jgi:hypothetical protein